MERFVPLCNRRGQLTKRNFKHVKTNVFSKLIETRMFREFQFKNEFREPKTQENQSCKHKHDAIIKTPRL